MKTKIALFLALLSMSCASVHHSRPKTVASAKDGGSDGGGASGSHVNGDGPEITPEELMSLLRGDQDEAPAKAECGKAAHCVNHQVISDGVSPGSLKAMTKVVRASKEGDTLMIELDTPGGAMQEGFELQKALEATKAKVVCVVDGSAYSLGYIILQSCQTRVMTKRSNLMTHEPALYSQSGSVATIPGLQGELDDLRATANAMAEHGARRLKITLEDYVARTTGKPWFMTWQVAKDVGAVDCVFAGTGTEALEQLEAKGELVCVK